MRAMKYRGAGRAVGLLVVALAILVAACGDDSSATTVASTTTATSTTVAPTVTLAAGKTPVASVGDLVALHTAVNEEDDAAHLGMITDDARMLYFFVYGLDGGPWPTLSMLSSERGSLLHQVMETGEVVVSGHAAAAVLRVVSPDVPVFVGFNTWVAEPVAGGFLCAGEASIVAEVSDEYAEADPAVVEELLAAQAAAWDAGDIDGVLAGYWEQATYMDGFTYEAHEAAELADFYTGMRLEFTGEPVISGPFVAVATRVTDLASGVFTDGVSVYWIREGEIALHTLTTGT